MSEHRYCARPSSSTESPSTTDYWQSSRNRLIDFRRIWQFGQCLLSHSVPTIRNGVLKILLLLPLNHLETTDRARLLSSKWKHATNNYQHLGGSLALEDWGFGQPGTQSLCWPFQTELTKKYRPSNIRAVSFLKRLFGGQLLLYIIYIKCSRWQMLIYKHYKTRKHTTPSNISICINLSK